jgi:hypothetical protein
VPLVFVRVRECLEEHVAAPRARSPSPFGWRHPASPSASPPHPPTAALPPSPATDRPLAGPLPLPLAPHSRRQDDRTLASRGTDGTLKLWDLRALKAPLKAFGGLPANYSTTGVCFSPDERLVCAAVAADPKAGDAGRGAVVFVDRRELAVVRALSMPAHAAAVRWHDRLNQIFVGVGAQGALGRGRCVFACVCVCVCVC